MERLTDTFYGNLDPWECCGQDYYCQRGCHDEGGCRNGCIVPKLYYRLAAYEDTGLTPEEVEALKAFKVYFDDMYGKGLEVANWHMNGNLEPFDNFYENANNAGKIHCRDCDYLNMDSRKPYCCHSRMSTSGLDDWCDHAKRKEN